MNRDPVNWTRLLAEALAIVMSILLAFAIDAAWDARGQRLRERSYLERLLTEFRDNRQDLIEDRADRDRILAGFAYVLSATGAPELASPSEIGSRLQNLSGNFRFYSPSHAVLNELVASGDLGLLRSDSLRHALLRYDEEQQRLAGVEESEQAIQRIVVVPYLAAHIEVLPWLPPPATRPARDFTDSQPRPQDLAPRPGFSEHDSPPLAARPHRPELQRARVD